MTGRFLAGAAFCLLGSPAVAQTLADGATISANTVSGSLLVVPEALGSSETAKVSPAPSEEPPKPLRRKSNVVIERAAAKWEPYSVRKSTEGLETILSSFKYRLRRASKVNTYARSHKAKDGRVLVISVHPEALKAQRAFVEIRFHVNDVNFLERAQIAAVTPREGRRAPAGIDSFGLRKAGVEFSELSPARAHIVVAALDHRPGRSSFNAGTVRGADFGSKELGLVNLSYSVDGVVDAGMR